MTYIIQKNGSNITTVIYSGGVDLNERKMAVEEVCESINPDEPVRLLIDVRNISMNMSEDEQEYFGKYLAAKDKLSKAKVAVVHNPQNNPNMVINTFAYIEGYQVVGFDKANDATAWLIGYLK